VVLQQPQAENNTLDRRNDRPDTDEILLGKINRAVAGLIVEDLAVKKAQAGLKSRAKEVGELLIEAKRRHRTVKASRPS
jgi:hypothetical protein